MPVNTEAEQALLGAILVNNAAYDRVDEFLKSEHFANGVHGRIYAAIGKLIESGQVADPITLKNLLEQDGVLQEIGGVQYVARLAEAAVTIINAEHYGRLIRDLHLRREVLAGHADAIAAINDDPATSIESLVDLHLHRLDDLLATSSRIALYPYDWVSAPAREWLYGRKLIRGFVSALIAPGGTGKSALAVTEALAMASGRPLLGVTPAASLRVWIASLEDPLSEQHRRIEAAIKYYGLTPEDIGDRLIVTGRETPLLLARDGRDGIEIAGSVVRSLKRQIKQHGIDVVIVDPFVRSHAVQENDNVAIAAVVGIWSEIADATNTAILLIHHTRKGGPGYTLSADDARGASGFIDAVRSADVISPMTKDEAKKADVDTPRRYFSSINGKANLALPPSKANWYELVSVTLSSGDSVAVVASWKWPGVYEEVGLTDLHKIQKVIERGEWRADVQATNWAGNAVAEVLGLDLKKPEAVERIKEQLKGWLESGALRVVMHRDDNRKNKKFIEVSQWVVL